jgi:hypothetical protein
MTASFWRFEILLPRQFNDGNRCRTICLPTLAGFQAQCDAFGLTVGPRVLNDRISQTQGFS